jgi:hypothetical protein
LINALNFVSEQTCGGGGRTQWGPDRGEYCQLEPGCPDYQEYKELITEGIEPGLFGQINLDNRKYAHSLLKLKKELGATY